MMKPSGFAVSIYVLSAISALLSVALAALTSHGLQGLAPTGPQAVEWFKIATPFQMDHALGAILVAAVADQLAAGRARQVMQIGAVSLLAGGVLFAGGLYSLSFNGPAFFAPWGGFAAMAGWILFAVGAVMALRKT